MSNLASVTCPSLHILVKSETEVFLIFGFLVKSLINHNCHNSKTSYDIYMKLGPVTNLARRNTTTSKKIDDDVVSTNYDVIIIFPIYGQFAANRKPDSGCMFCNSYIFINSNLLSYKNGNKNKIFLTEL